MEVQLEISVSLVWLGAIWVLRNERVSKDTQSHVKKNHCQTQNEEMMRKLMLQHFV